LISIRFFFLRGRSNRRTKIYTPSSKDAKSERNHAVGIAVIASAALVRIVLVINRVDRVHSSRIGVAAGVERSGETFLRAENGHKNVPLLRRCLRWMCSFARMSTASILWRGKSR
jgi:hypothetical protein